jgi:LemA protein
VIPILVIAVVVVLLFFYSVSVYNRLVRRRNQADNAWSQIDVQLGRRHDLIPNLVATVEGYASHERVTLEAVTQARANAMSARGPASKAAAESQLSDTLKSLFALAEAYPDLKASTNFLQLQEELANTEDRTAYARQYYNDAVLAYNNAVTTFPPSILAGMFSFKPREYFEATGEERGPVRVEF